MAAGSQQYRAQRICAIEMPHNSALPAKLMELHYSVRSAGISTRITAGEFVPVEIIEITLSGKVKCVQPARARISNSKPPPVTLPRFAFADSTLKPKHAKPLRVLPNEKSIRAGLDAWRAIGKAESFESWKISVRPWRSARLMHCVSLVPIEHGAALTAAHSAIG